MKYILDQAVGDGYNRLARANLAKSRNAYFKPYVSIHVPCCNEPPELVISTIKRLRESTYDYYEIIVIDNNTNDEALWRPVEEFCKHEHRVQFYHVGKLAGAKAGALNFALAVMNPNAQVVAIVDCDYQVDSNWISNYVGLLNNPFVGWVQMAQDYRDGGENAFKSLIYNYYMMPNKGFIKILNEDDATFTMGPMALINKYALLDAGGWDEDSITEDHSLGFAMHAAGYTGHYFPYSGGRGVMPETFMEFKKQRWRWCAGPIAMFKKLWRIYMPWDRSTLLTQAQKRWERVYLYVLADDVIMLGLELGTSIAGATTVLLIGDVAVPRAVFAIVGLCWLNRLVKLFKGAALADLHPSTWAGLLLVHDSLYLARAKAALSIFSKKLVFERASKFKELAGGWRKAVAESRHETVLGAAFLVVSAGLLYAAEGAGVAVLAGLVCFNAARKLLSSVVLALIQNK